MLPRGAGRKVRPFSLSPGIPLIKAKKVRHRGMVYHPANYTAGMKAPITTHGW